MQVDTEDLESTIQLVGWKDVDSSTMATARTTISSHAKKIAAVCPNLEQIMVLLKPVHKNETNQRYEIHVKVIHDGHTHTTEVTEHKLFVALDAALGKAASVIRHQHHH